MMMNVRGLLRGRARTNKPSHTLRLVYVMVYAYQMLAIVQLCNCM